MIVAISCQGKFADVAESEAMQISLHPDDPPWGLLGSAINRIPVLIIRIIENFMPKYQWNRQIQKSLCFLIFRILNLTLT